MPYRVVQWSTGNVGRHALAGIHAHPELELVGVYVSNPDKVGHDAGELAGLASTFGVAATSDAEALLGLEPDCIVHTAMADDRIFDALQDLERFLAAGINVVSSSPVMLQYPAPDDPLAAPVIAAAEKAGVSIFVNGVDPGFANDALPLVLSGVSERIEEVRCSEVLNYNTYNQPMVLFDIMGFGGAMDEVPFLLSPGVLTMAWGSVVRQIAAGLGVTLTDVTEWYEREAAPEDFEVDAGTIKAGTAAALHFEVRGMVGDRAVVVLEHVTRLRDDLGATWPQPAGQGCYRVEIKGEPNYTLDLQLMGTDGDHNTAGLKATAMRLVNAVPAVIASAPGLVTALDLPSSPAEVSSSRSNACSPGCCFRPVAPPMHNSAKEMTRERQARATRGRQERCAHHASVPGRHFFRHRRRRQGFPGGSAGHRLPAGGTRAGRRATGEHPAVRLPASDHFCGGEPSRHGAQFATRVRRPG